MKVILEKLINVIYVINYYHITGKYRRFTHHICKAECKLTQKRPVIFHNIK